MLKQINIKLKHVLRVFLAIKKEGFYNLYLKFIYKIQVDRIEQFSN